MAFTTSTPSEPPSLLQLIDIVDNVPPGFPLNDNNYLPLYIGKDTRPHGFVLRTISGVLPWPSCFTISETSIHLTATSAEEASATFQDLVNASRTVQPVGKSISIPGEHFLFPGQPFPGKIVQVERFASSIFGIATRGSHMTAYVRGSVQNPNEMSIWIARRSAHLYSYPGKLDSTVAGGVKSTDTPLECILAESDEEARLPRSLVQNRVKHTGVLTLANRNPKTGMFHGEILYVYDLELTQDEKPEPGDDDEVEEFILMPWREVLQRMQNAEFKPNVCPIMIDFFIRHGLITPDDEPRYVEICTRLRRVLPMATNAFE